MGSGLGFERPSLPSTLHISCSAECSSQGGCSKCGELLEVVRRLETKMINEISRVEQETQSTQRVITADLTKWKKEREACWKHVGELKDQNRHLSQRNYEMEVQNGHLQRHVALLQEQLQLFKSNQAQLQSVLTGMATVTSAASSHGGGAAALLGGSVMIPRVPHSGADIW